MCLMLKPDKRKRPKKEKQPRKPRKKSPWQANTEASQAKKTKRSADVPGQLYLGEWGVE